MTATAGTDTITINATASGLNEQVQFNNAGNFGGDADSHTINNKHFNN